MWSEADRCTPPRIIFARVIQIMEEKKKNNFAARQTDCKIVIIIPQMQIVHFVWFLEKKKNCVNKGENRVG